MLLSPPVWSLWTAFVISTDYNKCYHGNRIRYQFVLPDECVTDDIGWWLPWTLTVLKSCAEDSQ